MIIVASLINISLAVIYRVILIFSASKCILKPSRKLGKYFGGLFTELTMSSLGILFRVLFLQIALFDKAVKGGKFIWFIV